MMCELQWPPYQVFGSIEEPVGNNPGRQVFGGMAGQKEYRVCVSFPQPHWIGYTESASVTRIVTLGIQLQLNYSSVLVG